MKNNTKNIALMSLIVSFLTISNIFCPEGETPDQGPNILNPDKPSLEIDFEKRQENIDENLHKLQNQPKYSKEIPRPKTFTEKVKDRINATLDGITAAFKPTSSESMEDQQPGILKRIANTITDFVQRQVDKINNQIALHKAKKIATSQNTFGSVQEFINESNEKAKLKQLMKKLTTKQRQEVVNTFKESFQKGYLDIIKRNPTSNEALLELNKDIEAFRKDMQTLLSEIAPNEVIMSLEDRSDPDFYKAYEIFDMYKLDPTKPINSQISTLIDQKNLSLHKTSKSKLGHASADVLLKEYAQWIINSLKNPFANLYDRNPLMPQLDKKISINGISFSEFDPTLQDEIIRLAPDYIQEAFQREIEKPYQDTKAKKQQEFDIRDSQEKNELLLKLSADVIQKLPPEFFNDVTPETIQELTIEQIQALNPKMISSMSTILIQALTPEQLQALTPEQVQSLNFSQLSLEQLTDFKNINTLDRNDLITKLQNLRPDSIKALTPNINAGSLAKILNDLIQLNDKTTLKNFLDGLTDTQRAHLNANRSQKTIYTEAKQLTKEA